MDLNDCFRKGLIKKTRINEDLIKSLIEMSEIKMKTVKSANVDEVNISAYVSLAYDSLRELLEALCISKGYKVLSHICIGELLKDILDEFDYDDFDRLRYIRNSINYYGEKVDFDQGNEIIKKTFVMRRKILNYLG
tara:strand:- start:470 stop:877 length:408 start_codon:yes stop_codon:yes gene_type:complete